MSSLSSAHQRAGLEARHWLTRIESELSVAQQLAELHSDRKEAWLALSARASAHVEAAAGRGLESLRAAVLEAEELLAPVGAVAKTYVVHCVGHAHIDMNWMWSWPETVSVINDTFSTVLGLLDEYPEFCFSQSQASVYRAVEKHNPEMLARIADYVRRGRWEVTASHWVECDKNLVSGESLCRHLLYTRMYMQELFGLTPDDVPIDWAPDTFGHAATVPGYLVRGGVRYVYLHRPGVHTKEKPDAFIWQGLDGSQVLVKNDMRLGYNGVMTPDVARHAFGFAQATGCPSSLFVYGVGDHGGGPTRQDIERARDMNSWPIFPELRFDRAVAFFRKLEECDGLPVIHGELNTEFTGCYSSQSLIKKANRFSENRLFDAEFAACMAWAASGKSYPEAALISSWRDTLFSQFHDILPGSGVHDTRTYTHGLYQEVMATATMIETTALRGLAQRVATSELAGAAARKGHLPAEFTVSGLGGGAGSFCADGRLSVAEVNNDQGARPFVLFNPTLWDRDEVVEVFVWDRAVEGLPPIQNEQFSVRAPDGARLPVQAVGRGHDWGHQYVKLAFPVKVQGLGYATYLVEPTERPLEEPQPRVTALDPHHHCSYARPERAGFGLENQFLRVTLDPQTGFIGSLFDRRSGLELMQQAPSSNGILFGVERPHGMSSWLIDHTGLLHAGELISLQTLERGPYRARMEAKLCVSASRFSVVYELRYGDPTLYLHIEGTWFERGTPETGVPTLRVAFPFDLSQARATYEIPFSGLKRPHVHAEELPALEWVRVSGKSGGQTAGCVLANDCKHGHALEESTLWITLIRSSYDPDPLPEIGRHEIHLALEPFTGEQPEATAVRAARRLNRPLRIVGTGVHTGDFPLAAKLVSVDCDHAAISGLKKAERDQALLVRLYETDGRAAEATLFLNSGILGQATDVFEADLHENPLDSTRARIDGDRIRVALEPHSIKTLLVKLGRHAR